LAVIFALGYRGGVAGGACLKEDAMIFRQFLVPKTGCASYLFG
jgi:hypothetical protein